MIVARRSERVLSSFRPEWRIGMEGLARILQASISPVALISGVGLLILSMTNRFARVTDRLRELASIESGEGKKQHVAEQIDILLDRASLLRSAITYAVGCVLMASVLVLILFAMAVLRVNLQLLVFSLFSLSLLLLVGSLVQFLRDMQLSLKAVKALLRK